MTDSPVAGSSSSVVSPAPSYSPPISTVPNGEAQLGCEARPCRRLWEGSQLPSLNVTQVAPPPLVPRPPQASSPVCVWRLCTSGRSGREHQGVGCPVTVQHLHRGPGLRIVNILFSFKVKHHRIICTFYQYQSPCCLMRQPESRFLSRLYKSRVIVIESQTFTHVAELGW